jgi:EAL domain-containing protein (putative c-di-GMP-specific phosphodiesterase class I)
MLLDLLKLDMRFMQEVSKDPRKSGILKFIMELAELIHVPVIAEGVETEDQLNRLRSVNCQYAQGYYYAKPMKAADFEKLQYAGVKKPAAE